MMKSFKKNDIVPGVRIGAFFVAAPLSSLINLLLNTSACPDVPESELKFRIPNGLSVEYLHIGSTLKCSVDIRTGLCYLITIESHKDGITPHGIECGMTVPEAQERDPTLYLDETYEALYSKRDEGIGYVLDADDPLPDELPHLSIERIEIFHPQLLKVAEGFYKKWEEFEMIRAQALSRWRENISG